jgi:hypothetical protein
MSTSAETSLQQLNVEQITAMQHDCVARWHQQDPDNPHEGAGVLGAACQQHQFNFLLWHEEDVARSPDVGDARIAQVKRAIDGYNQQRNDWIEKIDEHLLEQLADVEAAPPADAPLNTETPGSAIDRLSIMSLRIYHLREQLDRTDVDAAHRAKVQERLARCCRQHRDLSGSLAALLSDIFTGRKRLELYRQFKMYNDPTLNPFLYGKAA